MEVSPEPMTEPSGLLDRIDAFLVGGLGMAALLLAAVNVVLRGTLPHLAIEWGDEVQVYLVIWAVCLSFSAVTARGRHIKADLFVDMMPPALRTGVAVLGDILGLAVSILLGYLAYGVTYEAWDFGDVSSTTLRFPIWIYQAALPLGMTLMALRYAIRLYSHLVPSAGKATAGEVRP